MKKFFIVLSVIIALFLNINNVGAVETKTGITFIYINGSNNLAYKNRLKFKVAFEEDVNKLHPQIKKYFDSDKLINEIFLKNGEYVINEKPVTFYWGDRSLDIVEKLDKDLKVASKYSPKIAHQARTIFAHCLHDAVWVQKQQNMKRVLDDLHKVVNSEINKGNKVVLLGYSAGSFVTYQYYMTKNNFINPAQVLHGKYEADIEDYITNTKVNPTCFDALVEADLIKYNSYIDRYEPNPNKDLFKAKYSDLDKYTQSACFQGNVVKGIIGFASPARLFYSDFINPKTSIHNISKMMAKSIIENDVFYLTVNYNNDPFGFANGDNFTFKQIKEDTYNFNENFKGGNGFIYNKSDNYVPRTFITAHLAYWQTPKRFAKAIVKAFNEGYPNFYGIK